MARLDMVGASGTIGLNLDNPLDFKKPELGEYSKITNNNVNAHR